MTDTIKQRVEVIELADGRRMEVRRMSWKAMRDFLRRLAAVITTVYTQSKPEDTRVAILLNKLPEIIGASDELVALLCTKSTGLTLDQFDETDALSASQILDAALKVNCDEELKNCWAGIAVKVVALMPANKTTTS